MTFGKEMSSNNIIEIIETPLFWVISAVGSIAFGVAGNLITPRVAGWLSQRSDKKRDVGTLKRARFFGEVIIRVSDPDKITGAKLDSIYTCLLACMAMLFALILFTAATALDWFLFPLFIRLGIAIFSIPVIWIAFYLAAVGVRWRRIATYAEKRISQEALFEATKTSEGTTVAEQMNEWDRQHFGITIDETDKIMKDRIQAKQ